MVTQNGEKEEVCLKDGKPIVSTLNDRARRGRCSLKAREKAGELVIVSTDKSGKLAVMEKNLYKQCMEPHIQGDTVHTREEVALVEKQLNGAASQLLRAFKFGENWGHEARVISAFLVENNEIPSLNQLVKDHKEVLSTRPMCRSQVKQAPNGPLSSLVCEIINPFVQEADKDRRTDLKSTEELCHEMNAANKEIMKNGVNRGPFQKDGNLTVGSKDVKCHYPNIDIDVLAEEAKLEVQESDIEIEMNTVEVALFLACTMSEEEINAEGLSHVVHKRRYKNGSRPGQEVPLSDLRIINGFHPLGSQPEGRREEWLGA